MSKSDCVLLSTQEIVFFHFQQWYTQNPGDGTETPNQITIITTEVEVSATAAAMAAAAKATATAVKNHHQK